MLRVPRPIPPSPLPVTKDVLKVLPLSDLHIKAHPSATEKLVSNRDYLERMDYIQLLGDQVGLYGTDQEYSAVGEFIARLPRPYGAVNGNHEFYFEVFHENSGNYGKFWREAKVQDKQLQLEKFKQFFGYEKLWRAEQNELGRFLFLGIDDVAHTKPETLSAPQLEFLEEQLRDARREPVYVFCHAPLYIDTRLDLTYYDDERTACVELDGAIRAYVQERTSPVFWMSGHIHLRPDHYMFAPYELKPNVWQIHCPDSWGYSRWEREHRVPQRHDGLFSRHLEIEKNRHTLITHNHIAQQDIRRETIEFDNI
jgi:hypothetical protein